MSNLYNLSASHYSPRVFVFHNVSEEERNFMLAGISLLGFKSRQWLENGAIQEYQSNSIFISDVLNNEILQFASEWGLNLTLVGRLNFEEKKLLYNSGFVSFWDLNEIGAELAVAGILKTYSSNIQWKGISWTGSKEYNSRLSNILKFFSMDVICPENKEHALILLKENNFDYMVLDWDNCGVETIILLREFKTIKQQNKHFPRVIGIKDFNKVNIFQDLSMGVKDYCPVLFTANEVLELFIRSLPFIEEAKKTTSKQNDEYPLLRPLYEPNQHSILLNYSSGAYQGSLFDISEIGVFKSQFSWLSSINTQI